MTLEYHVALVPTVAAVEHHLNRMTADGWRLAAVFPTMDLGVTDKICIIAERDAGTPAGDDS